MSMVNGSTMISNSLILEARFTPSEFRVLVYLCLYSEPRPSKYVIMDCTGISSLKALDSILKELRRLGVIDWVSGKKKSYNGGIPNTYKVLPRENWKLDERNDWRGRGYRMKQKHKQAQTRYLLKKGLAGGKLMLEPGEERPEEDDERNW